MPSIYGSTTGKTRGIYEANSSFIYGDDLFAVIKTGTILDKSSLKNSYYSYLDSYGYSTLKQYIKDDAYKIFDIGEVSNWGIKNNNREFLYKNNPLPVLSPESYLEVPRLRDSSSDKFPFAYHALTYDNNAFYKLELTKIGSDYKASLYTLTTTSILDNIKTENNKSQGSNMNQVSLTNGQFSQKVGGGTITSKTGIMFLAICGHGGEGNNGTGSGDYGGSAAGTVLLCINCEQFMKNSGNLGVFLGDTGVNSSVWIIENNSTATPIFLLEAGKNGKDRDPVEGGLVYLTTSTASRKTTYGFSFSRFAGGSSNKCVGITLADTKAKMQERELKFGDYYLIDNYEPVATPTGTDWGSPRTDLSQHAGGASIFSFFGAGGDGGLAYSRNSAGYAAIIEIYTTNGLTT